MRWLKGGDPAHVTTYKSQQHDWFLVSGLVVPTLSARSLSSWFFFSEYISGAVSTQQTISQRAIHLFVVDLVHVLELPEYQAAGSSQIPYTDN